MLDVKIDQTIKLWISQICSSRLTLFRLIYTMSSFGQGDVNQNDNAALTTPVISYNQAFWNFILFIYCNETNFKNLPRSAWCADNTCTARLIHLIESLFGANLNSSSAVFRHVNFHFMNHPRIFNSLKSIRDTSYVNFHLQRGLRTLCVQHFVIYSII